MEKVSSIAASNKKTCYHDSIRSKFVCVSNYTEVKKEVARERVTGESRLHFTISTDGKCTEAHPCEKQNGGCEHFCVRKGNDSGCDCKDGYIVVGKSC